MDISTRFSNPGIKAIFSYKSFTAEGVEGRKTLAEAAGFNTGSLIIPNQIHSTHILFCSDQGRVPECDGVFSTNPNLVCSIQVADCMPAYFAHRAEPVFGLVHAGWRGLVNGIFSESGTVLKYYEHVLTDFEIVIGPSIQNCCFEVSDDVVNQFDPCFVKNKKMESIGLTSKDSHWTGWEDRDLKKIKYRSCPTVHFAKINAIIPTDGMVKKQAG